MTSIPPETPKKDPVFATIQHYEVLYTTELTKKNKTWHDGTLNLHLLNGKLLLFNTKDHLLNESWFHSVIPQRTKVTALSKNLQQPLTANDVQGQRLQSKALLEEGLEIEMESHLIEVVGFLKISKTDVSFLSETRATRASGGGSSAGPSTSSFRKSVPSSTSKSRFSNPKPIESMPVRVPIADSGSSHSVMTSTSNQQTPSRSRPTGNGNGLSSSAQNSPAFKDSPAFKSLPPFKPPLKRLGSSDADRDRDNQRQRQETPKRSNLNLGLVISRSGSGSKRPVYKPSEEALKRAQKMEKECHKGGGNFRGGLDR